MHPFVLVTGLITIAWGAKTAIDLYGIGSGAAPTPPRDEGPNAWKASVTMTRPGAPSLDQSAPNGANLADSAEFFEWFASAPLFAGFAPDFFAKAPKWWIPPSDRAWDPFPPIGPPWRKKGQSWKEARESFGAWLTTYDGQRLISEWDRLHPSGKNPIRAILDHYLGAA